MSSRHGRSAAMHDPAAVDFYGVMGLPPLCEDVNAIRKAYTTLSKERHPDKPGGSKEQFQQLKDAYDCLVDADKKALYDSMFARRLRTEAEQKEKASREKQTAGSSRGAGASSSSTTQHPAQHGGSNYQFGKTAAEKRAQFRRERRAQRAEAGDDDKDEEKFSRGFRSRAEFRAFYETSRNAGNVPPPMAGSAYEKFYDRQEKKWRRDFEKREAASQGSYRRGRPGDYFYGFNAATMGGKFKVGEKKFTAQKTSKEAKREKRRQQKYAFEKEDEDGRRKKRNDGMEGDGSDDDFSGSSDSDMFGGRRKDYGSSEDSSDDDSSSLDDSDDSIGDDEAGRPDVDFGFAGDDGDPAARQRRKTPYDNAEEFLPGAYFSGARTRKRLRRVRRESSDSNEDVAGWGTYAGAKTDATDRKRQKFSFRYAGKRVDNYEDLGTYAEDAEPPDADRSEAEQRARAPHGEAAGPSNPFSFNDMMKEPKRAAAAARAARPPAPPPADNFAATAGREEEDDDVIALSSDSEYETRKDGTLAKKKVISLDTDSDKEVRCNYRGGFPGWGNRLLPAATATGTVTEDCAVGSDHETIGTLHLGGGGKRAPKATASRPPPQSAASPKLPKSVRIKQGRNLFQASAADEEVVDLDQQEEFDVLLEKLQEVEKIKRSEQEILAQREKEEKALKVMSGLSANMEKMMAMGAKAGGMMFPNMMPMMPNGMVNPMMMGMGMAGLNMMGTTSSAASGNAATSPDDGGGPPGGGTKAAASASPTAVAGRGSGSSSSSSSANANAASAAGTVVGGMGAGGVLPSMPFVPPLLSPQQLAMMASNLASMSASMGLSSMTLPPGSMMGVNAPGAGEASSSSSQHGQGRGQGPPPGGKSKSKSFDGGNKNKSFDGGKSKSFDGGTKGGGGGKNGRSSSIKGKPAGGKGDDYSKGGKTMGKDNKGSKNNKAGGGKTSNGGAWSKAGSKDTNLHVDMQQFSRKKSSREATGANAISVGNANAVAASSAADARDRDLRNTSSSNLAAGSDRRDRDRSRDRDRGRDSRWTAGYIGKKSGTNEREDKEDCPQRRRRTSPSDNGMDYTPPGAAPSRPPARHPEAKRSRREMLDPSAFWERNARAAAANEPRKHFTGYQMSYGVGPSGGTTGATASSRTNLSTLRSGESISESIQALGQPGGLLGSSSLPAAENPWSVPPGPGGLLGPSTEGGGGGDETENPWGAPPGVGAMAEDGFDSRGVLEAPPVVTVQAPNLRKLPTTR